jgi:hypothetical protein
MMLPKTGRAEYVDVTAAMKEGASGKTISLNVLDSMYEGNEEQ